MWGTWTGDNPARSWIEYRWPRAVTLNGSRIWFFADQPAGAGVGVAPPAGWHLEYWDGAERRWMRIGETSGYGTEPGVFPEVRFSAVTTRCMRSVFDAYRGGDRMAVGDVKSGTRCVDLEGGAG